MGDRLGIPGAVSFIFRVTVIYSSEQRFHNVLNEICAIIMQFLHKTRPRRWKKAPRRNASTLVQVKCVLLVLAVVDRGHHWTFDQSTCQASQRWTSLFYNLGDVPSAAQAADRHRFSAFWLRSKCSICSYQLNIWYVPHWGTTILNWFLELGEVSGACSAFATGWPGIAVPPGVAHSPRGL